MGNDGLFSVLCHLTGLRRSQLKREFSSRLATDFERMLITGPVQGDSLDSPWSRGLIQIMIKCVGCALVVKLLDVGGSE